MKLNGKLMITILGTTLLVLVIVASFTGLRTKTMSEQSAEELLFSQSSLLSSEFDAVMEDGMKSASVLASTLSEYQKSGQANREIANNMIKNVLEENPDYLSIFMMWEPDVFDGNDKHFANQYGSDSSGRYIPWVYRTDSGELEFDTPTGSIDENDFSYYTEPKETKKPVVATPYFYEMAGKEVLMTSLVQPIMDGNTFLGVIGIDFSLDKLNELNSQFKLYETGYTALLSDSGQIIAHPQSKMIGQNYSELATNALINENFEEIKKKISNKERHYTSSQADNGDLSYLLFEPLQIGETDTPWMVVTTVPENEVIANAKKLSFSIILISIAGLLVLSVVIFLIVRILVRNIFQLLHYGTEMADGNFTNALPKKTLARKDELGDIARVFQTISQNMNKMLKSVILKADSVNETALLMSASTEQSTHAIQEITKSTQLVAERGEQQQHSAEDSSRAMEEMAIGVHKVAESSSIIAEAAVLMDEESNEGLVLIQKVVEHNNHIHTESTKTTQSVMDLKKHSEEINEIIHVIKNISGQTNLLALNAAIEAARAGIYGKGFAVVADEIRKLADETDQSTKQIQDLIIVIQTRVEEVVERFMKNEEDIEKNQEFVRQVGERFRGIVGQTTDVSERISDLSAISEEMSAGSEEVAASVSEMARATAQNTENILTVAASTEEQQASIEELATAADTLQGMAEELKGLVHQFRV